MQRDVVLRLQCSCGELLEVRFDVTARPHWRTCQCPECLAVFEIMRPTILERAGGGKTLLRPDSERSGG